MFGCSGQVCVRSETDALAVGGVSRLLGERGVRPTDGHCARYQIESVRAACVLRVRRRPAIVHLLSVTAHASLFLQETRNPEQ